MAQRPTQSLAGIQTNWADDYMKGKALVLLWQCWSKSRAYPRIMVKSQRPPLPHQVSVICPQGNSFFRERDGTELGSAHSPLLDTLLLLWILRIMSILRPPVPQGQREGSGLKPGLRIETNRTAQGRNSQMARPEKPDHSERNPRRQAINLEIYLCIQAENRGSRTTNRAKESRNL